MTEKNYELDQDTIDQIKPFSGVQQAETPIDLLDSGKALIKSETKYTAAIAVQKPRSITRFQANVLNEAALAGASFYFRWPVKSKGGTSYVQGGSIDLAMCLYRHYGNCAVDVDVTETSTHYLFKAWFVDLESGSNLPRLFKQRKKQDIGMKDADRQDDIVFQIGQSKAQRNVILRSMPDWLTEKAIEIARNAEINSIKPENIEEAKAKAVAFFQGYGIDLETIESKLGKKSNKWTAEDITELRGMATGLREGRISASELFEVKEESERPKAETKTETKSKPEKSGMDLIYDLCADVQLSRKERDDFLAFCRGGKKRLTKDDIKYLETNFDAMLDNWRRIKEDKQDIEPARKSSNIANGEASDDISDKTSNTDMEAKERQNVLDVIIGTWTPEQIENAKQELGIAAVVTVDGAIALKDKLFEMYS